MTTMYVNGDFNLPGFYFENFHIDLMQNLINNECDHQIYYLLLL